LLDATFLLSSGLPAPHRPYYLYFIPLIQNNLGKLFPIHHFSVVSYGNELEVYPAGLKEIYETGRSFKLSAAAIYGQ
jgi:hypothetical protein